MLGITTKEVKTRL